MTIGNEWVKNEYSQSSALTCVLLIFILNFILNLIKSCLLAGHEFISLHNSLDMNSFKIVHCLYKCRLVLSVLSHFFILFIPHTWHPCWDSVELTITGKIGSGPRFLIFLQQLTFTSSLLSPSSLHFSNYLLSSILFHYLLSSILFHCLLSSSNSFPFF